MTTGCCYWNASAKAPSPVRLDHIVLKNNSQERPSRQEVFEKKQSTSANVVEKKAGAAAPISRDSFNCELTVSLSSSSFFLNSSIRDSSEWDGESESKSKSEATSDVAATCSLTGSSNHGAGSSSSSIGGEEESFHLSIFENNASRSDRSNASSESANDVDSDDDDASFYSEGRCSTTGSFTENTQELHKPSQMLCSTNSLLRSRSIVRYDSDDQKKDVSNSSLQSSCLQAVAAAAANVSTDSRMMNPPPREAPPSPQLPVRKSFDGPISQLRSEEKEERKQLTSSISPSGGRRIAPLCTRSLDQLDIMVLSKMTPLPPPPPTRTNDSSTSSIPHQSLPVTAGITPTATTTTASFDSEEIRVPPPVIISPLKRKNSILLRRSHYSPCTISPARSNQNHPCYHSSQPESTVRATCLSNLQLHQQQQQQDSCLRSPTTPLTSTSLVLCNEYSPDVGQSAPANCYLRNDHLTDDTDYNCPHHYYESVVVVHDLDQVVNDDTALNHSASAAQCGFPNAFFDYADGLSCPSPNSMGVIHNGDHASCCSFSTLSSMPSLPLDDSISSDDDDDDGEEESEAALHAAYKVDSSGMMSHSGPSNRYADQTLLYYANQLHHDHDTRTFASLSSSSSDSLLVDETKEHQIIDNDQVNYKNSPIRRHVVRYDSSEAPGTAVQRECLQ